MARAEALRVVGAIGGGFEAPDRREWLQRGVEAWLGGELWPRQRRSTERGRATTFVRLRVSVYSLLSSIGVCRLLIAGALTAT